MFNFRGNIPYDQDDVYICAIRNDYKVGDIIEKGSFRYKILDIDKVNQLMMIGKRGEVSWDEQKI